MVAVREASSKQNLKTDMSMSTKDRFMPQEWAMFLKNCKVQLGTETGVDFFDLEEKTRYRVNKFCCAHPDKLFNEVYEETMALYKNTQGMRCRLISGRVIESSACKSVLMLYEGEYEGYIKPDVHYVPVKLDHSNLDEALEKLKDIKFCNKLTEASYAVVKENFTFKKLIDDVFKHIKF